MACSQLRAGPPALLDSGFSPRFVPVSYLNNRLEQDHRGSKQRYYPLRGFGNFDAAALLPGLRRATAVFSPVSGAESAAPTVVRATTGTSCPISGAAAGGDGCLIDAVEGRRCLWTSSRICLS